MQLYFQQQIVVIFFSTIWSIQQEIVRTKKKAKKSNLRQFDEQDFLQFIVEGKNLIEDTGEIQANEKKYTEY